jgi:hypothetical protein
MTFLGVRCRVSGVGDRDSVWLSNRTDATSTMSLILRSGQSRNHTRLTPDT